MAAAIKHFKKADPVLHRVILALPKLDAKPRRNYFMSLVSSVISQQLSTKAARTIRGRFLGLFPGKSLPKPETVLAMSDAKMRAAGLSYSKIKYIKEIAKAFRDKQVLPHKFHRQTDEEIIEQLVQIKGIGRWTAEMFLMFSLGRPDVFSIGDLGLRNAIQKIYGLKHPPTPKQMEKIAKKWSPHRTVASRYLWISLEQK
jgi:DNA-3-methyladenine glycosylase II